MSVLVYCEFNEKDVVCVDTPVELARLKAILHNVIDTQGSIENWEDYKILRYCPETQITELATLSDEIVGNDDSEYEDDHLSDDEYADEDGHASDCNVRRCDCRKSYIWFRDNPKNRCIM